MSRKLARDYEKQIYETIKNQKVRYGQFHKTVFHIHTPASYDYKLLDTWEDKNYQGASEQDILDICKEKKVFPTNTSLNDIKLKKDLSIFKSKKEYLSYMLLANELLTNNIEIALVSDHHTVTGVDKLKTAIKTCKAMREFAVYTEIILGVEISCADKNHVVGIFKDNKKYKQKINKWLKENLLSVKDGAFITSFEVLKAIDSMGGIGYVAHIDTSNIFKKEIMNGAYKINLFSNQFSQILGIKNLDNRNQISKNMQKYNNKEIKFIPESDAHNIEDLSKNIFWIKGRKINYLMIKEALNDYDISINLKEDSVPNQYIKGIYVENRDKGFLHSKENDDSGFCLKFSNSLNCLIGGRGTGKSTVLELLEYILSQRCYNKRQLDFLCSHGNSCVLYDYHGEEYLIELVTIQKNHEDDDILQYFGQNPSQTYGYKHHFHEDEIMKFTLQKLITIKKVIHKNDELYFEAVNNKKNFINKLFDRRYSVNELVNTAGSEEINDFLYDILFQNNTLGKPEDLIKIKSKSGLKRILNEIDSILDKRKNAVQNIINPFNNTQKNILQIVYKQNYDIEFEPYFSKWLPSNYYHPKGWYKHYNITNENIIEFLLALYKKSGVFDFFKLVITNDVSKALNKINILDFCKEMNNDLVEQGVKAIDKSNMTIVTKQVFAQIIAEDNINSIISYLKEYISKMETFSLEFNINNKEGTNRSALYRPVNTLSLGQKVVAMLSFILGYSEYSNDYRPLIIDQPEDNLDNQYIYKNLVQQLRTIKEKRQVIIATHNATIVTNAKADQVCIMKSDNKNGWLEKAGYPGETQIKKHILNYLEGGIESFLHKISIYEEALGIETQTQDTK